MAACCPYILHKVSGSSIIYACSDRSGGARKAVKVRTTTIERHTFADEEYVSGRIEMQWTPGGEWFNLGINNYMSCDWDVLLILLESGAREMGVEINHECLIQ